MSIFAVLGLIPRGWVIGVMLAVVTLLGSLVQRQCTVMDQSAELKRLGKEVKSAQESVNEWQKKHTLCVDQRAKLEYANEGFSDKVRAQNMMVDAVRRDSEERIAFAKRAADTSKTEVEAQRQTIEWLSSMLKRSTAKPGECPEAEAASIVREGLTR